MFRLKGYPVLLIAPVLFSLCMESNAQALFSRGVNLTGWFQADSPRDIQFTRFTEKDFENIKSLGCDVVRLPINLHSMTSGSPYYILDPLFCGFLDSAVTWCENLKLYLILDDHSSDPNVNTDPGVGDVLSKVWGQMASRYSNRSDYILYEVLNEPHGITTQAWGPIQQEAITAIRASDTKHTIVVGGSGYNSYNELANLPSYSDTNLLYTFHFYDPFLFTHQGATWVSPSMASLAGVPFPYNLSSMPSCPADLVGTWIESDLKSGYMTEGNVSYIGNLIRRAAEFRDTRKVRIFCGEFGAYMENSANDDRCRWYSAVRSVLESLDIPWTSWDYKGGFGLFRKGSAELFGHDLNTELLDSMGLNVLPQTPFAIYPDSTGFVIYDDFAQSGIVSSFYGTGSADFYCTNTPEAGKYCIDWSGFSQYNAIVFDFIPDRDFSFLSSAGYALDFMLRGDKPGIRFEIRFTDAKTSDSDHPWRMGTTIDQLPGDLRWHHFFIPLSSFNERGAWDNNTWYNPQGLFDWKKVDAMQISTEWTDILGKRVWFDNICITDMDTAVVRVTQPVGVDRILAEPQVNCYPNPMKDKLYISLSLPGDCITSAEIYSSTGTKIRTLGITGLSQCSGTFLWDGRNESGREVPDGMYFCRIISGSINVIRKIIKY